MSEDKKPTVASEEVIGWMCEHVAHRIQEVIKEQVNAAGKPHLLKDSTSAKDLGRSIWELLRVCGVFYAEGYDETDDEQNDT